LGGGREGPKKGYIKMKTNGLVIWTAIIALATIANFWVGFNLKEITESSLNLRRAFIGQSSSKFQTGLVETDSSKKVIQISLTFENFGVIPAKDVCISVRYLLNNEVYDSTFVENRSLYPSQTYTITYVISKQLVYSVIMNGISRLKVETKINYCDPNGAYYTKDIIEYNSEKNSFQFTYSDWN